jgi:hypothetical protein
MQRIRGDEFAERIAAIRAATGTEIAKVLKRALPGFMLGAFSVRNNAGLTQPAGVIGLDVDDIGSAAVAQLRGQLASDSHCAYALRSPSGNGLKAGFWVDPDRAHEESWTAIRLYFEATYHYPVDPTGKDPARLVFFSHDPDAFVASAPPVRIEYPLAPPTPNVPGHVAVEGPKPLTAADCAELLRYVPSRPDYDTWLHIISAVGSALPEAEGIAVLQQWSPEQEPGEYAAKWNHRLQNVTVGTLIFMARQHGWSPSPSFKTRMPDAATEEAEKLVFFEKLSQREFGVGPVPVKPVPRILVNETSIATPGNLVTITAQAKSGKTAVIGAIIAAIMVADKTATALMGVDQAGLGAPPEDTVIQGFQPGACNMDAGQPTQAGFVGDCLGFTAAPPNGRAVVHIDTEQSPYDHHKGMLRALQRGGVDTRPSWLHSFGLASSGPDELRRVVQLLCDREAEAEGIYAVIIDGVADLCSDVNNAEEANALVAELHALAIRHTCPVICIIHENPTLAGSKTSVGKMRGHLGSQLERKAESNLRLTKKDEVTVIHADKNRGAPISVDHGPRIRWDDGASMHVSMISAFELKTIQKHKELRELAVEAFGDAPGLKYADLVASISASLKCPTKTGQKHFTAMRKAGVIHQDSGSDYWIFSTP